MEEVWRNFSDQVWQGLKARIWAIFGLNFKLRQVRLGLETQPMLVEEVIALKFCQVWVEVKMTLAKIGRNML